LENIDNMRKLDFASKIECANCFSILQPFKSNSYWFLYSEKNVLNFLCLDRNGNTLFEKKDLLKNKKIVEITYLYLACSKNKKTLFIYTEEKHLKQKQAFYYLRSFDENFNFLAEIKLDKESDDYEVNGENLFLLDKNCNYCTISMYNHNLEIIQTFGQENSTVPFFFPPEIDYFFVSNQYFIFYETLNNEDDDKYNNVTIMNRSNGLVETSFKIYEDFTSMRLYLDKFLITFNRVNCLLKCYNFEGDLLHQIILDKKLEGSYLDVINKELCFALAQDDIFFIF
jgi:hypothetical protein